MKSTLWAVQCASRVFRSGHVIAALVAMSCGLMGACAMTAGGDETPGGDGVASESSPVIVNTNNFIYDTGTQCTVGGTTMHCCPPGRAMVGARLDQNVFKCAALTVTSGVRSLDLGTQRNGMHACPFGSVMVGFRQDMNRLACQTLPGVGVSESIDGATQDGFPMHVCPTSFSYAMSGIHVGMNKFSCVTDFVIP